MLDLRLLTLRLSLVRNFGIHSYQKLIEKYQGLELTEIFHQTEVRELYEKVDANYCQALAQKYQFVCLWEENYPFLLKQITDPPLVLFYLGDLAILSRDTIAVVGTRNPSDYGRLVTKRFVESLSGDGFIIVSGLAYGIDGIAHKVALDTVSGSTAAVLATPVDLPSPAGHEGLYHRIVNQGGVVVSATVPGSAVSPGMFASRNRIIAGLSRSTLVTEAGNHSGALITASLAFDYNRQLFAIPGRIDAEKSIGTNYLIQSDKAKLVQQVGDIYQELGYQKVKTTGHGDRDNSVFDPLTQLIVQGIRDGKDSMDLLANTLRDQPRDVILSKLASLELNGYLERQANGKYCLTIL